MSTLALAVVVGGSFLVTPPGYSPAQLIRDDFFTAADTSFWCLGWAGPNCSLWQGGTSGTDSGSDPGSFNAEYSAVSQLGFGPNGLAITARPNSKYSGYSWVSGAMTSKATLPPAGKTTVYVQWSQQTPDMRYGAWPADWFLLNNGPAELDVFEGSFISGSIPINQNFASTVHWGSNQSQTDYNTGFDMSAGWHVYATEFVVGASWKTWIDGVLVKSTTANVPTAPMNLMMDLAIGQNRAWGTVATSGHNGPFVWSTREMQIYTK